VIFYHDVEQKAEAEESKARIESLGLYRRPVVTQIVPAATFYRAEDYHQQYLAKRGLDSCSTVF
jgi:peptide-methionine (S)-S-oxide reductase